MISPDPNVDSAIHVTIYASLLADGPRGPDDNESFLGSTSKNQFT